MAKRRKLTERTGVGYEQTLSQLVKRPNGMTVEESLEKMEEGKFSAYQPRHDDSLQTEAKTVAGAINELHADKLDVNNYFSKIGSSAMRPVYEACGAVWNEETGYYELNGLTDITEEEMLTIYAVFSDYKIEDINWKYAYTKARTNICPKYATYASKSYPNFNGQRAFYYSTIEVIKISDISISPDFGFALSQGGNMFDSCEKLKRIIGRLWVDKSNSLYAIFNNCSKLEDVQIYGLSLPISFSGSPLLNYASLYCLITNAVFMTAFISAPQFFTKLFVDADKLTAAALDYSCNFIVIVSSFLPVVCVKIVCDGAVRGCGGNLGFTISTFTDLILRVAFVYILTTPMGFAGVSWAWAIGWAIGAVVAVSFFFAIPCLRGVFFKNHTPKPQLR